MARSNQGRRRLAVIFGAGALVVGAVHPAFAHGWSSSSDARQALLAAELVGADEDELGELDALIDPDDPADDVQPVDAPDNEGADQDQSDASPADASENDQGEDADDQGDAQEEADSQEGASDHQASSEHDGSDAEGDSGDGGDSGDSGGD